MYTHAYVEEEGEEQNRETRLPKSGRRLLKKPSRTSHKKRCENAIEKTHKKKKKSYRSP